MSEAQAGLRVDRARLANARPGDRDRLASAFERVTPAATGVTDRGLLLIRRIRMARPLGAGMDGFASELIDRIRAEKAAASRNISGAGNSLWFEDEVALEIAIVRAWLAGETLPAVIRRAVPHSDTPRLRWRREILADARKLPRVIAALVEVRTAGPWLAQFDAAELRVATDLLVRAHGGSAAGGVDRMLGSVRLPTGKRAPPTPARRVAAIEEAVALAKLCATDVAARALIAVSLLAARRPELLATQAAGEAYAALSAPDSPPVTEISTPALVVSRTPTVGVSPIAEPSNQRAPSKAASHSIEGRQSRISPRAVRQTLADVRTPELPAHSAPTTQPQSWSAPAAAPPTTLPFAVASDHGGLFFLLNIFLALGLYGDFTDPRRQLRGLSPFELLLLLGRRWIGPAFISDPIEPVLRALAGLGPRERVGRNFEAPAWTVPSDWLASWPATTGRLVSSRFGSSRQHPAGFPIEDQWRVTRPEAWLRRRWIACLARYLEARVARALGSGDRAEGVGTLIRQRGTIEFDAERVEVIFALDTHPLVIRMAGLDRDPGWIPAAGRAIGFGFA
ncbi:hypothetical protein [Sphingomonas sp. LM7]|uniref:hypothetical protein n=1 Tax=Sphingomonas sp. LM7 TaxID=1938607 RepID=UPI00098390CB|nr:hypothetical protein [Sphingomonas sp. LM7]AQR73129.1 hypothetical protein BXU08_05060 [Sphingomonas sp. LM7]